MTIINKLNDRGGFIFDVIRIIVVNKGKMTVDKLQLELLQCGVYIQKELLRDALSRLIEKKILSRPNETVQQQSEASVQSQS